jgi:hypothetical protein
MGFSVALEMKFCLTRFRNSEKSQSETVDMYTILDNFFFF